MSLKFSNLIALTAVLLSSGVLHAQEQKDLNYWSQELKSRITLNGYAQAGYTYMNYDGRNSNTWDVKRTLLWAKARITDRWSFLFMHDFNSQVQEFYTDYRVTKGNELTIRFGQFKNQLSMENPLFPVVLETVDVCSQSVTYLTGCGSDPLFGINYGRDLGIDLFGQLFDGKLFYNLEFLNGRGINARDPDNRKNVIVKLDYRPIQGLRFAVSAQKGYATSLVPMSVYIPVENAIAQGEIYRRDRWTAGVEYKAGSNDFWKNRSWSVRGEVLGGRDGKTNSWGGYVTSTIPLAGQLDMVASFDYFDYAKGFDRERTEVIAGLQYWFFTKCRFQLQYTWASSWTDGLNTAWVDDACSRVQIQMQVAF